MMGLRAIVVALAIPLAVPLAASAADVGVSVSVGQPGFYGRIEVGNMPVPQLVYAEPVIVHAPPPGRAAPRAVYLHVPPGHAKNWAKHCAKYQACGQPVLFVRERWYHEVYVPRHAGGAKHPGKGKGPKKHD